MLPNPLDQADNKTLLSDYIYKDIEKTIKFLYIFVALVSLVFLSLGHYFMFNTDTTRSIFFYPAFGYSFLILTWICFDELNTVLKEMIDEQCPVVDFPLNVSFSIRLMGIDQLQVLIYALILYPIRLGLLFLFQMPELNNYLQDFPFASTMNIPMYCADFLTISLFLIYFRVYHMKQFYLLYTPD